ncbi:MAG: isoleucine--tRNA ligase [Candidatus Binatales bacterium]
MADTDYKATLNLPKTDFPMKANLPKREPETLKRWDEMDLYARLMEVRRNAKAWILHDGPPYANGNVHMGTALNKIVKDFIVRSRSMMGFRTPFVPGWDCHGMPIEHRVAKGLGARARTMPKIELRRLCRADAQHWIDAQRTDFRRLGVIGDWQHPYLTMNPEYDAAEIGVLRKLVEKGYVFRGRRPVHWCFDCRTALAEAEVEYRDHRSPSIYVKFALNSNLPDAAALASDPGGGAKLAAAHRDGKLFAVIWTTTPWTLPANLGISLNETFDYVALGVAGTYYIVAARLAEAVEKACALAVDDRIALSRAALKALDGRDIFRHPFIDRDVKLMFGDHVTADAGTGLVHTAPGHGYEDFVTGERYGLTPLTPVDDGGVFTAEAGEYAGRNVFAANDAIVAKLRERGALLHAETLAHSYPHCWRCRKPLIFRATEQWFMEVDHESLRKRVLAEMEQVQWWPGWSRDRIRNTIETRPPGWCLSRQKAWGVPIPALKCKGCGNVALDAAIMRRVEEIFEREGSDAWYVRPLADFVPVDYRCEQCGRGDFERQEDVLDVWFDSGCSQAAVLGVRPELAWPADAYVEAVEQARGWFQSSLLCATAERGAAPFRNVVSHGLTLDEQGRKMSKSLGNTEDASAVTNRIGADVIRLLYASVDYSADMNIGPTLLNAVAESYRKLRNTCRFLLGNLFDFDPARDSVAAAELLDFDRFILSRLERLKSTVRRAYDHYDFQTAYHQLLNFAVVDLSSLYIDVARDRLYCSIPASRERRSAQTALFNLLDAMVRMLAPLMPFTADEIYSYFPGQRAASVHLLEFAPARPEWADADLEARWDRLLEVRNEALKLLEAMRQAGTIGAPLEAVIKIGAPGGSEGRSNEANFLTSHRASLKDLFIVSDVTILSAAETADVERAATGGEPSSREGMFARFFGLPARVIVGERARGKKCERCWTYYDDGGDPRLCVRCRAVVRELGR